MVPLTDVIDCRVGRSLNPRHEDGYCREEAPAFRDIMTIYLGATTLPDRCTAEGDCGWLARGRS